MDNLNDLGQTPAAAAQMEALAEQHDSAARQAVDPRSWWPEGDTRWPAVGARFDNWFQNFAAFARLIQENPGFWSSDFALKYLEMRVDTRSGTYFTLGDRDGNPIHPDRVLRAIEARSGTYIQIVPTVPGHFQVDQISARTA